MLKNSPKDIKRRARSIANTQKITSAMEMVAASKMRRSQLRALAARPYAQAALNILGNLSRQDGDYDEHIRRALARNVFFKGRPNAQRALVVVITSDKGLIGGLNTSVLNEASRVVKEYQQRGFTVEVMAVGTKTKRFFEKAGIFLPDIFEGVGDLATAQEIDPIAAAIYEYFKKEPVAEVTAIYTEFVSTLKQRPARRTLLPISETLLREIIAAAQPEEGRYAGEGYAAQEEALPAPFSYTFEPSGEKLLAALVPVLFHTYVYHIILESNASEHSARMMAMRNASTNAERLLDELTLSYNKARQSAITQEINEVSSGAAALEN
ncbi:MAG: ATP synthase F1 subunit gamma [Candidatus Spechtbacterales bacterium]